MLVIIFFMACNNGHFMLPNFDEKLNICFLPIYLFFLLLQLQDYSKTPTGESEVKFSLSRVTLEPMLRSMAYISEQLSSPANKVAVINLKVCDDELDEIVVYLPFFFCMIQSTCQSVC